MKNNTTKINSYIFLLFCVPAIVLYTVFFTYPALSGVYFSLTDWNGINRVINFVGIKNYIKVFSDMRFLHAFKFNFYYSFIIIIFINTISLFYALLLNSKIKMRSFFRAVYFFPAVLSLVTVGLLWDQIFYAVIPKLGTFLNIEFLSENILANTHTAIYGIALVHIWQGIAIPTVLILAGLQTIPNELIESAKIDGSNVVQTFLNITLPYIIPILKVTFVLTLKAGLMVFDYIKVMTDGGPANSTESLGILIYKHAFFEMKLSYATAEALILFFVFASIAIIQIKFFNKKEVGRQ